MKNKKEIVNTPQIWWASKRKKYNIALIIAGIIAYICFATIQTEFQASLKSETEITLFTILFQGIGCLVIIGLANICYFLGPLLEKIIKPKNADQYRRISYNLGFWGSVLLPFSVPVLLLIQVFL